MTCPQLSLGTTPAPAFLSWATKEPSKFTLIQPEGGGSQAVLPSGFEPDLLDFAFPETTEGHFPLAEHLPLEIEISVSVDCIEIRENTSSGILVDLA